MITVRFVRMWSGFDPTKNPLLPMLSYCLESELRVVQNPRLAVDIEVTSVYPSRTTQYANMARVAWAKAGKAVSDARAKFIDPPKSPNAQLGIWYTPENVRPPASGWDVTLSFEPTGWTASNAYVPFWQLGTNLFGGHYASFLGRTVTIEELVQTRETNNSARGRFCCAFIRNPDPIRMQAIEELSSIGQVDVYGIAGGNQVKSKLDVATEYRFMLCFENDLYPGYVTEKVFDAWATGTVPLWWGLDREATLNPSAMINVAKYTKLADLVSRVSELNNDGALRDFITSQPLLSSAPSPIPAMQAVQGAWQRLSR